MHGGRIISVARVADADATRTRLCVALTASSWGASLGRPNQVQSSYAAVRPARRSGRLWGSWPHKRQHDGAHAACAGAAGRRVNRRSMSNPVGPRATHPRHRSRQRREGRLRAGRLPRRAATSEPILVVPTFADVEHYRARARRAAAPSSACASCAFVVARCARSRAGPGCAAEPLVARWRASASRRPRSPASGCEALAAAARDARLRPGAAAPRRPSSRSSAIEPGALVGRRCGRGREREPAPRGLRRGGRARCTAPTATACERLDRRDRAAARPGARSTRCAWSPRAGARRRSSSTASTTCTALQRDAVETLAVHAARAGHACRWPTSPGAWRSPGAATTFQELMALGRRARRAAGALAEHYEPQRASPASRSSATLFEPPASESIPTRATR